MKEKTTLNHKKKPLWLVFFLNFLLNPSTWITLSIALGAIGLLIQAVNLEAFLQAAVTLGIMQTVLTGLATLTLVGGLLYTLFHAVAFRKPPQRQDQDTSVTLKDEKPDQDFEEKHQNPYIAYLRQRRRRMIKIPELWMLWPVTGALILIAIALTIAYFAKGMLPDSYMGHILGIMGQAFFTIVHAMGGLPGLGCLNDISDVTLLLVGRILSAVILILGIFFMADTISRILEMVREPKELDTDPVSLGDTDSGLLVPGKSSDETTQFQPVFKQVPNLPWDDLQKALRPEQVKVNMTVRALRDNERYGTNDDYQIFFKANDVFTVTGYNDDWIFISGNGKEGWVPVNHFCAINSPSHQNSFRGGC